MSRVVQCGWAVAVLLGLLVSACEPAPAVAPAGSCKASTCDDHNPCTTDICAHGGQCQHVFRAETACIDAAKCVYDGTCKQGQCDGEVLDCEDGQPCTVDSCGEAGCVQLAAAPTICDDANSCTTDACAPSGACSHSPSVTACTDNNPCTAGDKCVGSTCVPGDIPATCKDNNLCTDDSCDPVSGACSHGLLAGPCDDGDSCTSADSCVAGACKGALDCACVKASGKPSAVPEDCATVTDDNCNGLINESAVCGATLYKFSQMPQCGAICYPDELHNLAVAGPGKALDSSGFDQWASGQLVDGVHGEDDWGADLGKGPSYEWVAWSSADFKLTFQFPKPRQVSLIRVGVNNSGTGSVIEPPQIVVRLGTDGQTWGPAVTYSVTAGSLVKLPLGARGDLLLQLSAQTARFVQLSFVTSGSWTFIDEVGFD